MTQIDLQQIWVEDSIISPLETGYQQRIDSLLQRPDLVGMSLSDLLFNEAGMFLRTNGPGALTSASIQGGDAQHTNLLWNDMPINSPMLGVTDLSIISLQGLNSIDILSGASANAFASSALGGSINLKSSPQFQKDWMLIEGVLGSFGNRSIQGQVNHGFTVGKSNMAFSTGVELRRHMNRFPYLDIYESPYEWEIMDHAAWTQQQFTAAWAATLGNRSVVEIHYWSTQALREIANPINANTASQKWQRDTATRVMSKLRFYINERHRLQWIGLYEFNNNHYIDSALSIDNQNRYRSMQQRLNYTMDVKKWLTFQSQINYQLIGAESGNYSGQQMQQMAGWMVKAGGRLPETRLGWELGSRFESQDWKQVAPMPFLLLNFKPWRQRSFALFTNLSRSVRMPTLNEKYWNPGGNLELRPETGYSAEVGLLFSPKYVHFRMVYFHSRYEDRIRWLPQGSFFAPQNISESVVQGVSFNTNSTWNWLSPVVVEIHTATTIQHAVGKFEPTAPSYRLSHVPVWSSSLGVKATYRRWWINSSLNVSSRRYINQDESAYMPGYAVLNLSTGWQMKGMPFTLVGRIDNSLNHQYQVLAWRPMPGRSFSLAIQFRG